MELDHQVQVSMHISLTRQAETWCHQQWGAPGDTWAWGVLPGIYSYQTYDYVWKFATADQALEFSLVWVGVCMVSSA
jgi:hypothetical protein